MNQMLKNSYNTNSFNGNWGRKFCRRGFSFQMMFSTQKILPRFNGGRCPVQGHPQLELWKRRLQGSGSRCGDVAGP